MDNYKEIKNYIHNDLKITKEDINKIIETTIEKQISILLKDESFINTIVSNHINYLFRHGEYKKPYYDRISDINEFIYNGLIDELGKVVHDNIKIKVGLKTDNLEIEDIK